MGSSISEHTLRVLKELKDRPDLQADEDLLREWSRTAMKGMTFDEWARCLSLMHQHDLMPKPKFTPIIITNAKL